MGWNAPTGNRTRRLASELPQTTPSTQSPIMLRTDRQVLLPLLLCLAGAVQTDAADGPKYDEKGALIRPDGWREWVYAGTPVTPNDMNDGKAAFPEFHNVYIDPASYAVFRKTGEFPHGTMIAKELVSVGTKAATSGNGYFQGEFQGLEISVKDRRRFVDEPGGWAYFSFGHEKVYTNTAAAFPTASCNACHESAADTDFVFTQYYPVLRAAMKEAEQGNGMKTEPKKMSADEAQEAAAAMGGDATSAADGGYEEALFKFLKERKYERFFGESEVRRSRAFAAHGEVRTYVNGKLAESLKLGAKEHPVGSFAVKELHKDGELIGWATSYKAKKDNGDGKGWYWFENLSTETVDKPVASGFGVALCIGCHSQGKDFVTTGWPLK